MRRETEKRSLSFRGARSDEESAFELSVHDLRITIHEKDQIPHPKEARIRDDRAGAKGRLGAVACHSEEREATRNLIDPRQGRDPSSEEARIRDDNRSKYRSPPVGGERGTSAFRRIPPHPQEARIRDDRARANGLRGTIVIVVIPNPPVSRVRNLDLVPYDPRSCTTDEVP